MSDVILTTGEDVNLTIVSGPTLKFYDVITIANTFSPVSLSAIDGTTYLIPAGKLLLSIAVVPAPGDRILSAGYTAGATQILDSEEITSNDAMTFTVGRRFNTATTIHFSDYVGDLILYIL